MSKVRLGIIGAGNMGSGHARNIKAGYCPEVELVAMADLKQDRRDWVNETFGDAVKVFNNGDELLESGIIDAVLIAVPHYYHPSFAIKAFEKDIHVMCEKPAGVYTKAVREMNAASEKTDKAFAMMFNQRTNCLYRKMKEIVSSGVYGEIRRVNWIITDWFRSQYYYDSGDWRATWNGEGGGVLLNQCPHQLDLLQWICGLPVKVQANLYEGHYHDIEVEDDVTAFMEFENGATGVFVTSTGDAAGTNRFEITMDGAKLVCENDKLFITKQDVKTSEFVKTSKNAFGTPNCVTEEVETDGENHQHVGVLNAFAAHILRGEPLVASGIEGIRGLTLSNAMHLSSWTNQMVTIPFDEDKYLELLNEKRANSKVKENVIDAVSDTSGSY